jgi:hypothetical protein
MPRPVIAAPAFRALTATAFLPRGGRNGTSHRNSYQDI